MSRESYLRIEEEFHLPHVTLLALSNENGLCSRFKEYDKNEPNKLRRIGGAKTTLLRIQAMNRFSQFCRNRSQDASEIPSRQLRPRTLVRLHHRRCHRSAHWDWGDPRRS
jgi:hypothetical protein